jgi:hypothetical protein
MPKFSNRSCKTASLEAIQKAHGAYLALVVDPTNWKAPIDARVDCPTGINIHDLAASIEEAINFMCGGCAIVRVLPGNQTLSVKAPGYYAIIGA